MTCSCFSPANGLAGKAILFTIEKFECLAEVRDNLFPALLRSCKLESTNYTFDWFSLKSTTTKLRSEKVEIIAAEEVSLSETFVAYCFIGNLISGSDNSVGRSYTEVNFVPNMSICTGITVYSNPCRGDTHVVSKPHFVCHVGTDNEFVSTTHERIVTLRLVTADPTDMSVERKREGLESFRSLKIFGCEAGCHLLIKEVA